MPPPTGARYCGSGRAALAAKPANSVPSHAGHAAVRSRARARPSDGGPRSFHQANPLVRPKLRRAAARGRVPTGRTVLNRRGATEQRCPSRPSCSAQAACWRDTTRSCRLPEPPALAHQRVPSCRRKIEGTCDRGHAVLKLAPNVESVRGIATEWTRTWVWLSPMMPGGYRFEVT